MTLNSICKGKIQSLLSEWKNWIFPPICPVCNGFCNAELICHLCWEMCAPLSPEGRCPHCFAESDRICPQCIRNPALVFARSWVFEKELAPLYLAQKARESIPFFLLFQWARLKWRIPDVILSMPGAKPLALSFSELLAKPYVDLLTFQETWTCDAEAILDNKILLLIDEESSLEELEGAISSLSNTFPKRGYVLSVFGRESDSQD